MAVKWHNGPGGSVFLRRQRVGPSSPAGASLAYVGLLLATDRPRASMISGGGCSNVSRWHCTQKHGSISFVPCARAFSGRHNTVLRGADKIKKGGGAANVSSDRWGSLFTSSVEESEKPSDRTSTTRRRGPKDNRRFDSTRGFPGGPGNLPLTFSGRRTPVRT